MQMLGKLHQGFRVTNIRNIETEFNARSFHAIPKRVSAGEGDSLMEIGAARRRVHPAGRVAILFLKFYLARRDILACFARAEAGKSRARGSRIEKIALASTVSSAIRSRLAAL